jgi:hypothetical protein
MLRLANSLLSVLLLAAGWAHAASPTDVKATYKIFKNGILIGQVNEHFERDREHYRIVSETVTDGALNWFIRDKLTIISEGRITPAGLLPLSYQYARASDESKTIRARFNWDQNVLHSDHDGKTESVELRPGTQDRLSVMYQFMLDMPRSVEVKTWMSNGKKVEQYLYRKQDDALLKTPAGEFDTVHYSRDTKSDEDKAQLWLARDRFFLPIRIVFDDRNGNRLDQTIVSLSTR